MEFFQRPQSSPSRLGILPGTFNPVTVAHLALAHAALPKLDEIVFVLPRAFPHKPYHGAHFEQRVQMLQAVLNPTPHFSIAASEGGLFTEIADECRVAYGPLVKLTFLCGRDAAERIANWDYGEPGAFDAMLRRFHLLVAARAGDYNVPPEWSGAIGRLELDGPFDHVSATEVRRRIANGAPWGHLVPEKVHQQVRDIYG
jgi:nicotinate-nucleotide adenylyltransferase